MELVGINILTILILLTASFFAGQLIFPFRSYTNINSSRQAMVSMICGIVFLFTLAINLYAGFRTIFFPQLIFLLLASSVLIYRTPKNSRFTFSNTAFFFRNVWVALLPALVISAIQAGNYGFWGDRLLLVDEDYGFFASVSNFLMEYKTENYMGILNQLPEFSALKIPYHYFDLWVAGLLSKSSGLNPLYVVHSTIPVLAISSFSLIILYPFNRISVLKKILIISVLCGGYFTAFGLFTNIPFLESTAFLGQSFWLFPKYLFLALLFAGFHIVFRKSKTTALFFLLPMMFMNVGMIPVICLFVSAWILYSFVFDRRRIAALAATSALLIAVGISIYLYYKESTSYIEKAGELDGVFTGENLILMAKIVLRTLADSVFVLFFMWLLLITLWFHYREKRKKVISVFLKDSLPGFLLLLSGILGYSLLNHSSMAAYELFYFVFFTSTAYLFFELFSRSLARLKNPMVLTLFIFLAAHSVFSFHYQQKKYTHQHYINKSDLKNLQEKFAVYSPNSKTGGHFLKDSIVNPRLLGFMQPAAVLPLIDPGLYTVQLNYSKLNPSDFIWPDAIIWQQQKPYHVLGTLQGRTNPEEIALMLISRLKISYLIENDYCFIPEYLSENIDFTIFEPSTRTKIHFLKTQGIWNQ